MTQTMDDAIRDAQRHADPATLIRKREREVSSLGDFGKPGQRARFIVTPNTPVARRDLSGMVVEYGWGPNFGRGWHVAPDQAEQPDILILSGPAEPGDLVGPWMWSDIKRAVAALEASFGK